MKAHPVDVLLAMFSIAFVVALIWQVDGRHGNSARAQVAPTPTAVWYCPPGVNCADLADTEYDHNGDGKINSTDLLLVALHYRIGGVVPQVCHPWVASPRDGTYSWQIDPGKLMDALILDGVVPRSVRICPP